MPREFVHWYALERARGQLTADSRVASLLSQHSAWAHLGAILPDAPYYLSLGHDQLGNDVAEAIHGRSGEDTFSLLARWTSRIVSRVPLEARGPFAALLLGFLSHLIVDQTMHPFIFYFTGDYYDPAPDARRSARRRHRLLEVFLDALVPTPPEKRIRRHSQTALQSSTLPLELFTEAAQEQFSELGPLSSSGCLSFWMECVRAIGLAQEVFLSNLAGIPARGLAALAPRAFGEFDALFSFGRRYCPEALRQTQRFQNPVSGSECVSSAAGLVELSVNRCFEAFQRAEAALFDGADVSTFLEERSGTSAAFDIFGVSVEKARYYSKDGLPIPGLFHER